MSKEQDFYKNVKLITIAHRLSCEFDYCPEFHECKDSFQEYLDLKATKEEVKEACEQWNGNRADEIVNALDRLFA